MLKKLGRNARGNPEGINLVTANKDGIVNIIDKCDADDPPRTKVREHRMTDKENSDIVTFKKSKVSIRNTTQQFTYRVYAFVKGTGIRIKICDRKKRSTVKISVKINT